MDLIWPASTPVGPFEVDGELLVAYVRDGRAEWWRSGDDGETWQRCDSPLEAEGWRFVEPTTAIAVPLP